jgi:hypothetical protein
MEKHLLGIHGATIIVVPSLLSLPKIQVVMVLLDL